MIPRALIVAAVAASLAGFAATLALEVEGPTPVDEQVLLSDASAFADERPRTSARLDGELATRGASAALPAAAEPQAPEGARREQSRQHPNGQLRDQVALDASGRPHGTYASYFESGAVWETGQFEHGAKTGVWRVLHENGTLREESTFVAGRAEGLRRTWNSEGALLREVTLHGLPDGPATSWHANGQLESQGAYDQGQRTGPWRFWNPDGSEDVRRSGEYLGDRRVEG